MIVNSAAMLVKYLVNAKEKSLILYGVGNIGKSVHRWLSEASLLEKVKAFAVTEKNEMQNSFCGTPILAIDEIEIKDTIYFLICVKDQKMREDIVTKLRNIGILDHKILVWGDSVFKLFEESTSNQYDISNKLMGYINNVLMKTIPLSELKFAVHITNHCNLNCAGCNQFVPLAEKGFMDLGMYTRDIERLASLSNHEAYRIQLIGGEPLINPNAIEYARIAREQFPYAKITFLSNGVVAKNLSSEFYSECQRLRIEVDFSPYPINIDYDSLKQYVQDKGVVCHVRDRVTTEFIKNPILLNPDEIRSFSTSRWLSCTYANDCINLYDGKLSCAIVNTIHWLKSKFPDETKDIRVSPSDYIDIYKVKSIDEIFQFFTKPTPFCKYCGREFASKFDWKKTEFNLNEWV